MRSPRRGWPGTPAPPGEVSERIDRSIPSLSICASRPSPMSRSMDSITLAPGLSPKMMPPSLAKPGSPSVSPAIPAPPARRGTVYRGAARDDHGRARADPASRRQQSRTPDRSPPVARSRPPIIAAAAAQARDGDSRRRTRSPRGTGARARRPGPRPAGGGGAQKRGDPPPRAASDNRSLPRTRTTAQRQLRGRCQADQQHIRSREESLI